MSHNNQEQDRQATSVSDLIVEKPVKRSFLRWLILVIVVLVGAALIWPFLAAEQKDTAPRYYTEESRIGNLIVRISATGNLQPTNQVEIGSELSGIVDEVFVDVNGRVSQGQILARLDSSKLEDAVTMSQASLNVAQAQVIQAEATADEARATLNRYRKVAELSGGKLPSASDMETAEAALKRAEADIAVANAGVIQARAELQSDETNLEKANIRSPIDGVVLTREVDPGQTVAASLQAPVLFTLAEDLANMELQVDVDEADVGQVKDGQQAIFTVDAYPDREYTAVITRVSFGAQDSDDVVSYLTTLAVSNDDLSLRPGMTGTAEITTLVRDNVLLVPNAALRFTPATTNDTSTESSGSIVSKLMPRPPRQTTKKQAVQNGTPRIWVLENGQPVPYDVKTGASNGSVTEVSGDQLKAGMPVITEALSGGAS
ncbi:MAG: efflux RND transporter periplasmic adaptor subunit [Desulfuromonas sp.]|nr:MAG: efflux RND transporter periplasmic adaptor subunit [Desulfuromonas sp.]